MLVPFAFWNKTAFLAERVLGNVITSGIKVMVLAVIVGIGSSYFGKFVGALKGQEADINQAMSLVLASLTILGLAIFGPGIASGLVSGAPQLGAGAALGTVGAAAGAGMLAGGAVMGAARAFAGVGGSALGAIKAAASVGGRNGNANGPSNSGGGMPSPSGPSPAGGGGTGGRSPPSTAATAAGAGAGASPQDQPDWARKMQDEQRLRGHLQMAQAAIASGDQPIASANPNISQKD